MQACTRIISPPPSPPNLNPARPTETIPARRGSHAEASSRRRDKPERWGAHEERDTAAPRPWTSRRRDA